MIISKLLRLDINPMKSSAYSPTIGEIIGELLIGKLLQCNYLEFLKACLN